MSATRPLPKTAVQDHQAQQSKEARAAEMAGVQDWPSSFDRKGFRKSNQIRPSTFCITKGRFVKRRAQVSNELRRKVHSCMEHFFSWVKVLRSISMHGYSREFLLQDSLGRDFL